MNKVQAKIEAEREAKLLAKLKGPKGDKGDKGDKGEPGEPGKDGHIPKLDIDYFIIPGPRGHPGRDGSDGDPLDYELVLKLDQTTPQTVADGTPVFNEGWRSNGVNYSCLDNLASYKIRSSYTGPYSQLSIGLSTTEEYAFIQSNNAAGTTLPIQFWIDAAPKLTILANGNVDIDSGQIGNIVTVTDTYNVLATDYTVVGNKNTDFTITLPTTTVGQIYTIKNIGLGIVTVDGNGADTIDGELTQTLDQWEAMKIQCYDDNKWIII